MAFNVLLTAFSLAVVRAHASFNAEELSSAIYDVDILGEPKLATEMVRFAMVVNCVHCTSCML